ncbi:MAG: protein kinase [Polyangiales bacterium]
MTRQDRSDLPGARKPALPERIGERYEVLALLGTGGSAAVYRVRDHTTGRELALKQLTAAAGAKGRDHITQFEREFHLLAQLAHPQVIAVYDYGAPRSGPYYTMELLDGGDLSELSPLPWQKACALAYDVCSSLALLHSRRFVHRDISPLNIRCTKAGSAKLIDFGAVVPMGVPPQLIGTPAFVAPEVVNRALLDARTDLYSLGASLYFVLTNQYAYPALSFDELADCWLRKPFPPSALVPEIPGGLDELVMSLLSLEPGLRPRNAFEVMQRLSAIAGLSPAESVAVPRAYLTAPSMVGRDAVRQTIRGRLQAAARGGGSSTLIEGPVGSGCSRMLDACALDAKTLGLHVLRARALGSAQPFATARQLLVELIESVPTTQRTRLLAVEGMGRLFEETTPRELSQAGDATLVQADLLRLISVLCEQLPVLIAVDDVHDVDGPSVAFLAALADASASQHLALLLAADSDATARDEEAFAVLQSQSQRQTLAGLRLADTAALITSLFGDVPNVPLLSDRVHEVAAGNPGRTLELAQWLVDQGAIRYASGAWSLPEQLRAADLPASVDQGSRARLARLRPLARELAECQALAVQDRFQHADYAALGLAADSSSLEQALNQLLFEQVLTSDGRLYKLSSQALAEGLRSPLTAEQTAERHAALARMFHGPGHAEILAAFHLRWAGSERAAVDRLLAHFKVEDAQGSDRVSGAPPVPYKIMSWLYRECLEIAERIGVPPRGLRELRRRMVLVSVVGDDASYWRGAPDWLENLRQDSGLAEWQARSDIADAGQRLSHAFGLAFERWTATPEAERGYRPDEAIQYLVHYVALSIVIAVRSLVRSLAESLPPLLEPFAPMSPAVHAIWQNALAVCENQATHVLGASARWNEVLIRLAAVSGDELRYLDAIRNAIAFGIGTIEASLGVANAGRWAKQLDSDPLQRVNAMYLRKVMALQQGDWDAAESCRKRAEILAVQAASRQMFTTMLPSELSAHTRASDLVGVQHISERIDRIAEQAESWIAFRHLARGQFHRLRGDYVQARQEIEVAIARCDPRRDDPQPTMLAFCPTAAAYVEVLVELNEVTHAQQWGKATLACLRQLGVDAAAWELERAVALADGKAGDYHAASERLDALIGAQTALGVEGLHLGASYEARIRVAIWAGDLPAIEEYGRLTAEQYKRGLGSPLGKRYERILEEAERAGAFLAPLSELAFQA